MFSGMLTLQKKKIPQIALQPVRTISKLVGVYKRRDADKMIIRFCPSSRDKVKS